MKLWILTDEILLLVSRNFQKVFTGSNFQPFLKEASPGPWENIHIHCGEEVLRRGTQTSFEDDRPKGWIQKEKDAVLIVCMHSYLPELLAVAEAAEALSKAVDMNKHISTHSRNKMDALILAVKKLSKRGQ